MRNYELINEIYAELIAGNGKGQFTNPYLNTVMTLTKLIEKERPELKRVMLATKQEHIVAFGSDSWENDRDSWDQ